MSCTPMAISHAVTADAGHPGGPINSSPLTNDVLLKPLRYAGREPVLFVQRPSVQAKEHSCSTRPLLALYTAYFQ